VFILKIKSKLSLLAAFLLLFGFLKPWKGPEESSIPTVSTLNAESTFLRNNTIHVVAKAYTSEESRKYLNENLLKSGYQPVQITIQNNSADEFSLSTGSVDLPTVSSSKVAKIVTNAALPRSIAYKIVGIFFWPMVFPSTIDSVITIKNYTSFKNDLQSKILKKEVVAPYSIYNRVVFVPSDQFKESFDLTLIELSSLKPKVIHISGLEVGKTVEANSNVELVLDKSIPKNLQEDTQSAAENG